MGTRRAIRPTRRLNGGDAYVRAQSLVRKDQLDWKSRSETIRRARDARRSRRVWARASLLHVPRAEMGDVLTRLRRALRPAGLLYASFKYGMDEGWEGERLLQPLTPASCSVPRSRRQEGCRSWRCGSPRTCAQAAAPSSGLTSWHSASQAPVLTERRRQGGLLLNKSRSTGLCGIAHAAPLPLFLKQGTHSSPYSQLNAASFCATRRSAASQPVWRYPPIASLYTPTASAFSASPEYMSPKCS